LSELSGSRLPISGASQKQASERDLQERAERQLNNLVSEIRLLESYYQEVVAREQAVSDALTETRSAVEAIDGLAKNPKAEVLLPLGAGILLPAKELEPKKYVVSVGSGVAIEKDVDSARTFLQSRQKELESGISSLEQQRREIGSRLEAGRSALKSITGQAE
jgi:prefoldin alpha subunit